MRLAAHALTLLVVCGLFASLRGSPEKLFSDYDSTAYFNVADAIAAGTYFQKLPESERSMDYLARTPGFPLLILLARQVSTTPYAINFMINALFCALSLLLWSIALRKMLPVWPIALVMLGVSSKFRFYDMMMTEFVSYNLLLAILAVTLRFIELPDRKRIAALGLLISAAVLIRPALVLLPGFLILGMLWTRLRGSFSAWITLLFALAPLWGWMSFNYYRLGSFALTGVPGIQLFTIASIVGDAPISADDSIATSTAIRTINAARYNVSSETMQAMMNYNSEAHDRVFNGYIKNTYGLLPEVALRNGWSVPEQDNFAKLYATRAISHNWRRYLKVVLFNSAANLMFWHVLLTMILALVGFSRLGSNYRPIATAGILAFVFHLSQTCFYAFVTVVHGRYYYLTLAVLIFYIMLMAGLLAARILSSIRQKSPSAHGHGG